MADALALPPETPFGASPFVRVEVDGQSAAKWQAATHASYTTLFAQHIDTENLVETSSPQYNQIAIVGRPENILSFAGVSNREVSLNFMFRAYEQADMPKVREAAKWLDALKYPYRADDGLLYPPPAVTLTFGNVLRMRSVVTSCTIRWTGGMSADDGTSSPGSSNLVFQGADVEVTFTSVRAETFQAANVSPDSADRFVTTPAASSIAPSSGDIGGRFGTPTRLMGPGSF